MNHHRRRRSRLLLFILLISLCIFTGYTVLIILLFEHNNKENIPKNKNDNGMIITATTTPIIPKTSSESDIGKKINNNDSPNNDDNYNTTATVTMNNNNDNNFVSSSSISDSIIDYQFPTVEERVRYMMGEWYNRSWTVDFVKEKNICSMFQYYKVIEWDFFTTPQNLNLLLNSKKHRGKYSSIEFFQDVKRVINEVSKNNNDTNDENTYNDGNTNSKSNKKTDEEEEEEIPFGLIMRIGDNIGSLFRTIFPKSNPPGTIIEYPLIKKGRRIRMYERNKFAHPEKTEFTKQDNEHMKQIIWPMEIHRHLVEPLKTLKEIVEGESSPSSNSSIIIPSWEEKKSILLWRGVCSGMMHGIRFLATSMFQSNENNLTDIGYSSCHLRKYQKYVRNKMTIQEQLSYRHILVLEGNDIASSLKWSLAASDTVVFMPKPSVSTAAGLEEFLVPYIHYVPLYDNLTNVIDQIEWAMQNEKECRRISQRATEFIQRLWDSPRAQNELQAVRKELGFRYYHQFGKALYYSCKDIIDDNDKKKKTVKK